MPSIPLNSSGTATFHLSPLPAGSHTITAADGGDPTYAPASNRPPPYPHDAADHHDHRNNLHPTPTIMTSSP